MNVTVGDKVLVFDSKMWNGKDVGDNSQFYKEAIVISISEFDNPRVATVRFEHDGRESRGHFVYAMRPLPSEERNLIERYILEVEVEGEPPTVEQSEAAANAAAKVLCVPSGVCVNWLVRHKITSTERR